MTVAFIKAVVGIVFILGGWLAVQSAWRYVTGASRDKTRWPGDLVAEGVIVGRVATARTQRLLNPISWEQIDAVTRLRYFEALRSEGRW